jgi:ribosome-binding protein aMBF1 (putative translation factor)
VKKQNTQEIRQKVASIIQFARLKLGLTQQEVADRLECQVQTISKIENAKYSPNADILYQLADCLNINITINNEKI